MKPCGGAETAVSPFSMFVTVTVPLSVAHGLGSLPVRARIFVPNAPMRDARTAAPPVPMSIVT